MSPQILQSLQHNFAKLISIHQSSLDYLKDHFKNGEIPESTYVTTIRNLKKIRDRKVMYQKAIKAEIKASKRPKNSNKHGMEDKRYFAWAERGME